MIYKFSLHQFLWSKSPQNSKNTCWETIEICEISKYLIFRRQRLNFCRVCVYILGRSNLIFYHSSLNLRILIIKSSENKPRKETHRLTMPLPVVWETLTGESRIKSKSAHDVATQETVLLLLSLALHHLYIGHVISLTLNYTRYLTYSH